LLVRADPTAPDVGAFEAHVLATAVEVDDDLVAAVREAVSALRETGYQTPLTSEDYQAANTGGLEHWVPICPSPDRLYNVYAEEDTFHLPSAAEEDARSDLAVLGVPPGLRRSAFECLVMAVLDQMPLVNEIDRKAAEGLPDQDAAALLAEKGSLMYEPVVHWRIFKDWLIHFFPGRYRRRAVSEEVLRSRTIRRGS
jgi:hypothetical protein